MNELQCDYAGSQIVTAVDRDASSHAVALWLPVDSRSKEENLSHSFTLRTCDFNVEAAAGALFTVYY